MSAISSPRLSIASSRGHSPGPASSRPSLDTLNTNLPGGLSAASTPSTARAISPNPNTGRRNRSALRDYYKLKPPGTDSPSGSRSRSVPRNTDAGDISNPSALPSGTELDNADFDPQRYVDQLLSTSSLSTILKAENTLVGDIRTLDGERKALVYDNYSKLIRAVETIGKNASKEGEEHRRRINEERSQRPAANDNKIEKETVQWVLDAPRRLDKYITDEKQEEADKDWDEVKKLLDAWGQVKGVSEVREACEKVMNKDGKDD
ncbi:Vacuolar protein sorting-associated protein 51 [Penicillium hetheringtonii]|uniref:Vacuolar protein sorting-associated protein 51 homolog n=1 Tax=Penicillium hetheringtonii TaxID=911720 RepID=A0AAD6DBV0_9EURO|nr:Vacuolar protein sorting-associated protein 51 [Penicillium hetheringtonii]